MTCCPPSRTRRTVRWIVPLLAPLAAFAAPPAPDKGLDACPVALSLVFTGLGDVPTGQHDVQVCLGEGDATVARDFSIDSPVSVNDSIAARLTLARKGDAYDLDLEVGPRQFSARGMKAGAGGAPEPPVPLTGKNATAPVASVRLQSLSEPHIGVDVTDAHLRRLATDVATLKNIEIVHADRIDDAKTVSIYLSAMPVRNLLQIVASEAGLDVRPAGKTRYEFGVSRNAAAIDAGRRRVSTLREGEDKAALHASLLTIVALADDTKAEGWEPWIGPELDELAALAEDAEKWADAEKWRKRQLLNLESVPDLPVSGRGIALARLADLRRRQGDQAGAADFRQRARAVLKQIDTGDATGRSSVLAALGTSEFNAGHLAEAAADSERAYAAIASAGAPDFDELWPVAKLANEIGNHYADAQQYAAAHVHMECNFALQQRIYGADAPDIDVYRTALMFNALARNDRALAAKYQEQQIAVSERRADPVSTDYAMALIHLTPYLVQQRRLDDATRRWQQVVDLRARCYGPQHAIVVQGLRELALLQRLNGRDEQAAATRRRADGITPQAAAADGDAALRAALESELRYHLRAIYDAALLYPGTARVPDLEQAQVYERRGIVALELGEEAAPYLRSALDLRERVQGTDHADTRRTRALLQSAAAE